MNPKREQVEFDIAAHSIDAVQRAAYRFSDRLAIDLHLVDETIACELTFLQEANAVGQAELVAQFKIEVLDQTLRERIRYETADVRNLILALAFSNVTQDVPEQT